MKKMIKGFANLIIIAALLLGGSVIAKATTTEITHDCGKNATWAYNKDTSTLTISGKGTITNNEAWYSLKVKKVVIQKGITRIGYGTFEEMATVKEVSIPETVKEIKGWAFARTGLRKITIDKHINDVEGNIFSNCKSLVSVTWNTEEIPYDTFYKCKRLTEIHFGKRVKKIGAYAFCGTAIKNLEIPDSVHKVEGNAFSGCKKLTTLKLSKNIEVIPRYIASNTPNLKTIVVKEGTKTINKNAFSKTGAVEIKLPESIEDIKTAAFSKASNLKGIKISDKITIIKDNTFYKCSKLETIEIGKSVLSIGEAAFKGCKALKEVVIPNNVTSIGYQAFEKAGCEKVTIGNSVTMIDYWAFSNCDKLKTISIGEKVNFVAENAFADCDALTSIVVDKNNSLYSTKEGCLFDKAGTTLITVPAGKTGVFEIPSGVNKIETTAFYGCGKITGYATNKNTNFKAADGILYNKYFTTLITCPSSKTGTINIPNTVIAIGESAFQHSQAANIVIPNSVTTIGYSAFEYCNNLTNINIPGSVRKISNAAFWECKNLRRVTIGKGTLKIQRNAFHGCGKLRKITIPLSVTSISKSAFSECDNVTFYCKKSSRAMAYATRRYYINYKLI